MAESEVVRIAREYREQLARNEDEALKSMSRYWVKMEKTMQDSFILLAQEIKYLQASGQAVPVQYVYDMRRYREMLEQIMKELPYYQLTVEDLIKEYQRKDYLLGLDSASAVLRASEPSDMIWNQVGKDAAETMAGFAGNGAPLAKLLQSDYGEVASAVTDALVTGVGLGKGVNAVAKDMRDAMGMEYNRSMRIARTEINRSYRLANAEQYRKSGVVTKVLRLCYPPTACFACLMMDGEECPKGICEDHPNGKCTTIAVTVGGVYPEWQHGEDWLMEQSEEDQRRIMGDGRYELWKQGVPLRDMVYMKDNPVWGAAPAVKTIKDLKPVSDIFDMFSEPVFGSSKAIEVLEEQPKADPVWLQGIIDNAYKKGISIERSEAVDRHLEKLGYEGLTFSSGEILLHTKASRSGAYEELWHYGEQKRNGFKQLSDKEVVEQEIFVQKKLLQYAKAYKISDYEIELISRNLDYYEKMLVKYK